MLSIATGRPVFDWYSSIEQVDVFFLETLKCAVLRRSAFVAASFQKQVHKPLSLAHGQLSQRPGCIFLEHNGNDYSRTGKMRSEDAVSRVASVRCEPPYPRRTTVATISEGLCLSFGDATVPRPWPFCCRCPALRAPCRPRLRQTSRVTLRAGYGRGPWVRGPFAQRAIWIRYIFLDGVFGNELFFALGLPHGADCPAAWTPLARTLQNKQLRKPARRAYVAHGQGPYEQHSCIHSASPAVSACGKTILHVCTGD